MTTTTFKDLELRPDMQKAIDEMGFLNATPVQAQTIPIIREGVDVLAQSRTGTGKTLAFSIPALECVDASHHGVQVLILSPTRELAQQCGQEVRKLSRHMSHIRTADIFGGSDYNSQFRALKRANFVIGTPGRIMDHLQRGTLQLDTLRMIILDEADEMLNMGFKEDIETILKDAAEDRQTLLFSATVPKEILNISKQFLKDPTRINLVQEQATLKEIRQGYVSCAKSDKMAALKLLILFHRPQRAIIFSNTKSMVDEIASELAQAGLSARGIHGDMKQRQRTQVMGDFKSGNCQILVATDVAARGIDVSGVDFVFNYDIPKMADYYVHRIGRTGRAGRSGTAISLCVGRAQIAVMRGLGKTLQSEIEEMPIPTVEHIQMGELAGHVEALANLMEKATPRPAQHMLIDTLLGMGYSERDIATALAASLFSSSALGLENLQNPTEHKGRVPQSSTFASIKLDIGAAFRCKPNHIVGAITERCGISSKYLGKIVIEEMYSLVDVPSDLIHELLTELKGLKICGRPVKATEGPARKRGAKGPRGHKSFDGPPAYARKPKARSKDS